MISSNPVAQPIPGRELVVSRLIDAPCERVFTVWTTRLSEWWGPHGTTTRVRKLNLCPGGAFLTVMRAADGSEYSTRGIFLEITAPERIVFTDAFDDGWRPHPGVFFTCLATFERFGTRTNYTARALHWTIANRERHEKMGFHQGWGESIDRFVDVVMRG